MTTKCAYCGKDNDDGAGVMRALVLMAIGLAMAIGLFQLFSWFRWLCGWGG